MGAHAIAMPRLGMTMEEGTVVDWPVRIGERVERGSTVLVIENEKNESEIEATVSGTLRHVYVEPGEVAPCGALLAAVTDRPDEAFDAEAFAAAWVPAGRAAAGAASRPGTAEPARPASGTVRDGSAASAAGAEAGGSQATTAGVAPEGRSGARPAGARKPVAPAARALARELGVDPTQVDGTGPNGRVTKADVEAFATARRAGLVGLVGLAGLVGLVEVEPGVGLEVLREGEGQGEGKGAGDPVVLLPGFGTDVSAFALQTPQLAERFAVLGVNPRGVGRSDAPDTPSYEVGRAADDVAAVLEAPAHVVGASLGAAVAIELALRHPQAVRSLTLLTPFVVAGPRLLALLRAWCRAAAETTPETLAEILAPWLFGDRLLGDEAVRGRTLRGLATSVRRVPATTLERTAAGLRAWSGTRAGDLGQIEAPTLVLAAEDDLLTHDGRRIAAAIPKAHVETVAGCGHALAIDGAETVTRHLLAHVGGAWPGRA